MTISQDTTIQAYQLRKGGAPARYMVLFDGKWRRVYCAIFSNIGTCYIGDYFKKQGEIITVGDIS